MTYKVGNREGLTSNLRHGHNRAGKVSRTYKAWRDMLNRCRYPDRACYIDYAGRGITVCAEWNPSMGGGFIAFLADMGEAPEQRYLDRRDNEKGYSKDNCRWATRVEQNQNQRSNINITFAGETHCVAEWARNLGIHELVIYKRLYRGWTPERALSTPVKGKQL